MSKFEYNVYSYIQYVDRRTFTYIKLQCVSCNGLCECFLRRKFMSSIATVALVVVNVYGFI